MNSATTKTNQYRILVVDDNPTASEYYEPHINAAWGQMHDVVVEMVSNMNDALNRLSTATYGALIMSWKDRSFDGGSFLSNLRAYGLRTPAVIVSNLQRGDIRVNIEASGAVFLNKGLLSGSALRDAVASSIRLINQAQSSSDGVMRRFPFRSKPPRATPPM